NVQLFIHAVPGTADESAYERGVRKLADGDPRVAFAPALPRSEVAATMSQHDALVVPSVWLETGPLVVFEAQAVGLYGVGSRRGGIAELVDKSDGGELVEPSSVPAWTAVIARLAARHANAALPRRPCKVRTMAATAAEMADLYRSL